MSILRESRRSLAVALAFAATTAACASAPAPTVTPLPASSVAAGDARIIHHAATGRTATFDAMIADLATADAVFLGERHDDAATHRLQVAVVRALAARRSGVLSLEMFERDVQPALDDYLAGRIGEDAFLANARPWPNYVSDYRPMVEQARRAGWPVIAANVPRPLAALVARGGLSALDTLDAARRAHVAAELRCPDDAYRAKFFAQMDGAGGHGASPHGGSDVVQRYYEAQCVKDETMAESIASVMRPGTLLVHVNGSFHSDEGLGTPERLLRRRPHAVVRIVAFVPAEEDATLPAARLGDWIVLTLAAEPRSR